MKRKSQPSQAPPPPARDEPVIDSTLLEGARAALQSDTLVRVTKCVVCGAPGAPNSTEGLCWVCRRLKISAWRDSDQQALQE